MNPYRPGKGPYITADQAAVTCLESLEREPMTFGWWSHELLAQVVNSATTSMIHTNFYKAAIKSFERRQAEAAAKAKNQ